MIFYRNATSHNKKECCTMYNTPCTIIFRSMHLIFIILQIMKNIVNKNHLVNHTIKHKFYNPYFSLIS